MNPSFTTTSNLSVRGLCHCPHGNCSCSGRGGDCFFENDKNFVLNLKFGRSGWDGSGEPAALLLLLLYNHGGGGGGGHGGGGCTRGGGGQGSDGGRGGEARVATCVTYPATRHPCPAWVSAGHRGSPGVKAGRTEEEGLQ